MARKNNRLSDAQVMNRKIRNAERFINDNNRNEGENDSVS